MKEVKKIKEEKISSAQLSMLLFMIITSTLLQFVPATTTRIAGESAWLIPLTLPLFLSLFMFWVYVKLTERFPGLNLYQFSEIIVGKWGARSLGLAYVFFFIVSDMVIIREFSDFVNVVMLPHTPPWAVILGLGFVGIYGAYLGIEVVARANQFVLPLFCLSFIFTTSLSLLHIVPARLFPLFKDGIMPIIQGSVAPTGWYGEIVIYLMLLPLLNNFADYKKKTVFALVMVSLFLTIDIALSIMVFSAPLVSKFSYSFWSLVRNVEYQDYIQRIESVIVAFWVTGVVIKTAVFCYLGSQLAAQIFKLKSYHSALLPLSAAKLGGAIYLFKSTFTLQSFIFYFWLYVGYLFELILPLGLLILAVLRKKQRKGAAR